MNSWPILLAVMLLPLTRSTLVDSDADLLDKDENQAKKRCLEKYQDEDNGKRLFTRKFLRRFKCGILLDIKEWTEKKIYKMVKKLIHAMFGDNVKLSDVFKKKIFERVMDIMLNVLKDVWKNRDKPAREIVAAAIISILNGLSSSGPETEKPVESGPLANSTRIAESQTE